MNKDEEMIEFEESEREKEIKREIFKMKEAMRYEKQQQKSKRRRLNGIREKKESKAAENSANKVREEEERKRVKGRNYVRWHSNPIK